MARRPWGQQGTEDELRDAFTIFDHGSNGMLNAAEMRHTLKTLGETLTDEELDKMMTRFPTDGDGMVRYEGK